LVPLAGDVAASSPSPHAPGRVVTPGQSPTAAINTPNAAQHSALTAAQIAPEQLRQQASVSAQQFERLCDAAMRALDDEALGWFERRLPWGSYGMLARASSGAGTLGLALARWCRQHGLLTNAIALELIVQGGVAEIRLTERQPLRTSPEFARVSVLRNLHGLACWWIASRLPLRAARFTHAAPAHASAYAGMFPGPAEFGAPHTALVFDAAYLKLPVVRDEAALSRMLHRALPLMVVPYRRDRLLVDRLVRILRTQPEVAHTADSLARQLHVSVRSLHRQLLAEGESLQALKDRMRRERAQQLLRGPLPVADVAAAVGFANAKAFSRAFSQWTGLSPQAFRQQSKAMDVPKAPGDAPGDGV
jgi:AraC-like DNA-binding protein